VGEARNPKRVWLGELQSVDVKMLPVAREWFHHVLALKEFGKEEDESEYL
jgi:hypothetical protein